MGATARSARSSMRFATRPGCSGCDRRRSRTIAPPPVDTPGCRDRNRDRGRIGGRQQECDVVPCEVWLLPWVLSAHTATSASDRPEQLHVLRATGLGWLVATIATSQWPYGPALDVCRGKSITRQATTRDARPTCLPAHPPTCSGFYRTDFQQPRVDVARRTTVCLATRHQHPLAGRIGRFNPTGAGARASPGCRA